MNFFPEVPVKGRIVSIVEIEELCHRKGLPRLLDRIQKDPPSKPFKSDGCTAFFDRIGGVNIYPACFFHDLKYWAGFPNESPTERLERFIADAELMTDAAILRRSLYRRDFVPRRPRRRRAGWFGIFVGFWEDPMTQKGKRMAKKKTHFEPYLYLPALTHEEAIIAWGGFFFEYKVKDGEEKWDGAPVEDNDLPNGRRQSIGIRSESYGRAHVELTNESTRRTETIDAEANHVRLRDLTPDTAYSYRVFVDGKEWAAGPRRDWNFSRDDDGGLWLRGQSKDRQYENIFRTFPSPDVPAESLVFAVIGDFGRGVKENTDEDSDVCQREVAAALEFAVANEDVRFVLTTGDNIYAQRAALVFTSDEGEEDDDWFFTYFQPYRYIINRVPVFPVIGNHDSDETEKEADRSQIYDNFYLAEPFRQLRKPGEIQATDKGLFYRFGYGSDIDFLCIDTSTEDGICHFQRPASREWLRNMLEQGEPQWRILFCHHPAYCAGPQHNDFRPLQTWMENVGRSGGIRVVFSGHEHNFQYAQKHGEHHFLTGGGGKYRKSSLKQSRLDDSNIVAWGGNDEGHFLLVEIAEQRLTVRPYGHLKDGQSRPIGIKSVGAGGITEPFVISIGKSSP